jgi:hypothetical protein
MFTTLQVSVQVLVRAVDATVMAEAEAEAVLALAILAIRDVLQTLVLERRVGLEGLAAPRPAQHLFVAPPALPVVLAAQEEILETLEVLGTQALRQTQPITIL